MKFRYIKIFFIIIIYLLISCDFFDLSGLFNSSAVDDRFKEKDSLKCPNPPMIADPSNFNFTVITDLHYYKTQLNHIKNLDKSNIDFIVVDGDIAQDGLQEHYNLASNDFATTTLPIYTTIGNHDLYRNGFEIYKKIFGRTVYEIKIGNKLQMIFLDTANGTLGELQKNWLEDTLKNSNCTYKIVFTHYSPTDDSSWEPLTTMSYPEDSYYLFDLLDRYNVDYCICGHQHAYDYKQIRGVKYIIVSNAASNNNAHLKISINNGILSHTIF